MVGAGQVRSDNFSTFKNFKRIMQASLVSVGTILIPIGLIGIFFGAIFAPELAHQNFGVSKENNPNNFYPFVFAAGIRDGVLGIIGLTLRFKYPKALLEFYAAIFLIPIADLMVVLHYNGTVMDGIAHVLGAFGILILIILIAISDRAIGRTINKQQKLKPV